MNYNYYNNYNLNEIYSKGYQYQNLSHFYNYQNYNQYPQYYNYNNYNNQKNNNIPNQIQYNQKNINYQPKSSREIKKESIENKYDDHKLFFKKIMKLEKEINENIKKKNELNNNCIICKKPNPRNCITLKCGYICCKKCLNKRISNKYNNEGIYECPCTKENCYYIMNKTSVKNGLIDEVALECIIKNRKKCLDFNNLTLCVNEKCKYYNEPFIIQNIQLNNIECINCKYNIILFRIKFCKKCKISPYHEDKTCEEYKNDIIKKCRFCDCKLNNNNELQICSKKECQEYSKICCNKRLNCFHYCIGLKEDDKCIECHNKGCLTDDDNCVICLSSLHSSPCIKLSCKHIFHLNCLIVYLF